MMLLLRLIHDAVTVVQSTLTSMGSDLVTTRIHVKATANKVYPTLAAGVTVTGGAAAWELGVFATVVPALTITTSFIMDSVTVEVPTAGAIGELVLYRGADDVEFARVRTTDNGLRFGFTAFEVLANEKIRAKFASLAGGAQTAVVSIGYHIS